MDYPVAVQVFHIPADGSPCQLLTLSTREVDTRELYKLDQTTDRWESRLRHVPDLTPYRNRINLGCRSLLKKDYSVGAEKPEDWQGRYFIYKCITKTKMGLPKNRNLYHVENSCVYGDAFIFKLSDFEALNGYHNPIYGNMEDFAFSYHRAKGAYYMAEQMATWGAEKGEEENHKTESLH